jgi:peptidoglycan hydrolase CwlO-like protein
MKILRKVLLLISLLVLVLINPVRARSQSCEESCDDKTGDEKLSCLQGVKVACQEKLAETAAKKSTLQSAIDFLDSKIYLTQSEINQTIYEIEQLEGEIGNLTGKITTLDFSLDQITLLLNNRIQTSYKNGRVNPVYLLLTSGGLNQFLTRYKYLQIAQENDRQAIFDLEEARANFDAQKTQKEVKQEQVLGLQTELIGQRQVLDGQQQEKETLLVITKHDESRYQESLAKAQAELAAIQAIIAGQGTESIVGTVNEGDKIASVIPAASACSTGAHLHYEVVKNGGHLNPASYLVSKSVIWDIPESERFSFIGSWQWPINDPPRITQGYGHTSYSSIYVGGVHTGIDMVNNNKDYTVKASRKGTLYRGSIACGGGTLVYVHVDHADDEYDTYYLHVNYF